MEFEKKYFEKNYQNYNKQNPYRKLKSYLDEILKYKNSGNLLDIGCAYGSFLRQARKFFDVDGIDPSHYAIKIAKKQGLKATVEKGDKTNFKDNSFDVVTMFDVIEHIEDLDLLFLELKRVLKPDGILVLSMPVYDKLAGKIVSLIDKDPTHVHKRSRNFWLNTLRRQGFDILEYKGIMRYFLLKSYYIHFLTKMFKNQTPAILLIGKN